MARADSLPLRKQAALHGLQRTRLRLMVVAAQGEFKSPASSASVQGWLGLLTLLVNALGRLPWLDAMLPTGQDEATPDPDAPESHAPSDGTPPGLPLTSALALLWRQHPLIGSGLLAVGVALLWQQRSTLRRALTSPAAPELICMLGLQAAPWLANWISEVWGAPTEAPPAAAEPPSDP